MNEEHPPHHEHTYRIQELERKVEGLQRQNNLNNARYEATTTRTDRRIRDLEIKVFAHQGVPQKKLAEIWDISPSRVNQIIKRVA